MWWFPIFIYGPLSYVSFAFADPLFVLLLELDFGGARATWVGQREKLSSRLANAKLYCWVWN